MGFQSRRFVDSRQRRLQRTSSYFPLFVERTDFSQSNFFVSFRFWNSSFQRLILRVETLHDSYRLLLYSSYWLINRTELALQFQVDFSRSKRTLSSNIVDFLWIRSIRSKHRFLMLTRRFSFLRTNSGPQKAKKSTLFDFSFFWRNRCFLEHFQGRVRVGNETGWSEQIPMAVISSVDMTCSKRNDGFSYFVWKTRRSSFFFGKKSFFFDFSKICVSITTSSFGLTRLVTFSPSFAVINRSTVRQKSFGKRRMWIFDRI